MAQGFGGVDDNEEQDTQPAARRGQFTDLFDTTPASTPERRTEKTARAARTGGKTVIDDATLDKILTNEGATHLKPMVKAILGQESGGNLKVGNSIDGAVGPGQMIPATFARFAKEGETIDNPTDNIAASVRYIKRLAELSGNNPAKIAAGYFSGEGNIGNGDTPYKADTKDGNGKHVSAYVPEVLARMGGAQIGSATPAPLANAPKWASIVNDPRYEKLTPEQKAEARDGYFQMYIAPSVKDEERSAAREWFDSQADAMEPQEKGLFDKVGDALSSLNKAATAPAYKGDDYSAPDLPGMDQSGAQPAGAPAAPTAQAGSTTPLSEAGRARVEAAYNAATPEQRAQMAQRPDAFGQYAKYLDDRYKQQDAAMTQVPADGASRNLQIAADPRAEARTSNLVRNGMDPALAPSWATEGARRGDIPGEEVGQATKSNFDFETLKRYNEDPFFKNPLVRGAVKGYEGLRQGALGVNQALGELIGADEFAQSQAFGAKKSRDFTTAMGEAKDYPTRMFEGAVSSISQQLPALLAGAISGSEAVVLGNMFVQTFGQEYAEGRARGQSENEAAVRSGIFGAFEVIGEKFGLHENLQAIKMAAQGAATKDLAAVLAKALVKEIPGEELTTAGQFLTDKLPGGVGLNTEAGLADYLQQAADTLVQTVMQSGLMMGGTSGISSSARYARNRGEGDNLQAVTAEAAREKALAKAEEMFAPLNRNKQTTTDTTAAPVAQPDAYERKEPTLDEPAAPNTAPTETAATPPGAAPQSQADVLGFADSRLQTLEAVRDGFADHELGLGDGTARPLTADEQAELDFLERHGKDEAKLREFYNLDDGIPTLTEQPEIPTLTDKIEPQPAQQETSPELDAALNDVADALDAQPKSEKEARERRFTPEREVKLMDGHVARVERAIANGVNNATLAPTIGGHHTKGYAKRQIKAYEDALTRAGWTMHREGKAKVWTKGGGELFLRSQGDSGSAIVQWSSRKDQQIDGKPVTSDVAKRNEEIRSEIASWGFAPNAFDRSTYSSGLLSPHFAAGAREKLPLVKRDDAGPQVTIHLAKAPNGEWASGFEAWRDDYTYATAKTTYRNTSIAPDGRAHYKTRDEAIAGTMAQLKEFVEPEVYAKAEQDLRNMADAPNHGELPPAIAPGVPNGQYGTVDKPLRFVSGMSRPGDFKTAFAANNNVGVSVGELSWESIHSGAIARAMADSDGAHLFVDSGAYSLFQAIKRAKKKGVELDLKTGLPQGVKPLDFEKIMDKYEGLARAIGEADDSGHASERVFFVMPDIVGDQAGSLELANEWGGYIKQWGVQAIVPLQSGELTLTQAYQAMMLSLGKDPDAHGVVSPIIGIPTNKMAASNEELTELLQKYGHAIPGVHILGAASDSKLQPRLDAIKAAGYDGNVSSDATVIRKFLNDSPRAEALQKSLKALYGGSDKAAPRTARERLKRENPFLAFLGEHGVHVDDRADTGGDPRKPVMIPGYGPLYKKTAPRLDELALLAQEKGFLTRADIDAEDDNGGVNKLADMIERAAHKKENITARDEAPSADEATLAEAERLGIDTEGKSADEIYEAVAQHYRDQEAEQNWDANPDYIATQESVSDLPDATLTHVDEAEGLRALGYTDEEIREIQAQRENRQDTGSTETPAAGTTALDHHAGNGETGAEGFQLQGQTENQARLKQREAEKRAKEARDRANAPDAGDFLLTGSDRPADQAAANGAQELFPPQDALSQEQQAAMDDLKNALGDVADILSQNTRLNITPEQKAKLFPALVRVFDALYRLGKAQFKIAAQTAMKLLREKFGDEVADQIKLQHLQGAYIAAMEDRGTEGGADDSHAVFSYKTLDQLLQEGEQHAPATGPDSEQGSEGPTTADARGNADLSDEPGAAGQHAQGTKAATPGSGDRPAGGTGVHGTRPAVPGEGSSGQLPFERGEFQPAWDSAGNHPTGGTGGNRRDGSAAAGGTATTTPDAGEQTAVEPAALFAEKLKQQAQANNLPVTLGERASIDKTLPILLEGQREDVHKAETRFTKPTGYGMLFTNGTGTGKTWLGMGAVRRMVSAGKKSIIIIAPDATFDGWGDAAKALGVDLYKLEGTTDANNGSGVILTNYDKFRDNPHLASRDYDMVVVDEAHRLMQGKDGDVTNALATLRAITHHPDGAVRRTDMVEHELVAAMDANRAEQEGIRALMNTGEARDDTAKWRKYNEELQDAERRMDALRDRYNKALEKQRAIIDAKQGEQRARALFLSATPFSYEHAIQWAHGYLFDYPEVRQRGYNTPSPYGQFMIEHFGWRMRTGKLTQPDANVNRGLMQVEFNKWMQNQGVLSTRLLDVPADYDRKFVLVDGGIGARIDSAMQWLREAHDGLYSGLLKSAEDKLDFLAKSRLLEAIKAQAAIPYIKKHHALGRKVVVYYDYNEGGGIAPFDWGISDDKVINSSVREGGKYVAKQFRFGDFRREFEAKFPELVGDDLGKLKSPLETLLEAFPQAGVWNGQAKRKKTRKQDIRDFNNDAKPEKNLLLVQSAANEGWSGHDTTGKFQRVLLNLGLPVAPVKAIQQEGRIYRVGQVSNALFRYMNTGTLFERIAFAQKVAERADTVENLGMGELARGLKDVFIDAFQNSGEFEPSADEGTGGKETDRAAAKLQLSEYEKAKALYYGQMKRDNRTKAMEGNDYFATPEPVGLKMVQWLRPKEGDRFLEPSAGHGAIARWFPENHARTVIEPSVELASRLALATDAKLVNERFEEHHIVNKYDGIAMNPPFGVGGKLAMEHVAKAFEHLADGGRIVALVPSGPAMDKRLQAWLESDAAKSAAVRMVVSLPSVTFKRAGTGVASSILVIDRVNDPALREPLMEMNAQTLGDVKFLNKVDDINDLFDKLEHMEAPARVEVEAKPTEKAAPATHGDLSQYRYEVRDGKLVTDAPPAKPYTTQKGKVLEGVYVPTKELAKQVDKFAFRAAGMPGFFVRMEHVERPTGGTFEDLADRGTGAWSNEGSERQVRARQTLKKLQTQLEQEKITQQEFIERVGALVDGLDQAAALRENKKAFAKRERGELIVREKLLNAKRRGALPSDVVDFTLWLLDKNPNLAHGLALSIKTPGLNSPGGLYQSVERLMTLFKHHLRAESGVHEIMHHAERMMPPDVQEPIRQAWKAAWKDAVTDAAARRDVPELRALLDMANANLGDATATKEVKQAFSDGVLTYEDHYQLVNPSEYWAVNAARILADRNGAERSWVRRAAQFLKELFEKIKDVVGLKSDAPILHALDAVLEGDGRFLSPSMLAGGSNHFEDMGDIRRKVASKSVEVVSSVFAKDAKAFNWYHKSFGLQLHKAMINPFYKPVYRAATRLLSHVSLAAVRASEEAPHILPPVDKFVPALRTAVLGARSMGNLKSVTRAIFAGTMQGESVFDGKVWTDDELRDQFGMKDKEIGLYHEARAAIDHSLMEAGAGEAWAHAALFVPPALRERVIDNVANAHDLIGRALDNTLAVHRLRIGNLQQLLAGLERIQTDALRDYTRAAEQFEAWRAAHPGEPAYGLHASAPARTVYDRLTRTKKTLDDAMAEVAKYQGKLSKAQADAAPVFKAKEAVDKVFTTVEKLQQAGYAPLSRFGNHTVDVVKLDANGKPTRVHFSRYDNKQQAAAAEHRMKRLYSNQNEYRVSRGYLPEDAFKEFQGVNPEMLEIFARELGAEKVLEKYFSKAVSDRSALKRRLHRDNVAGFSEDLPRVLASFLTSNARYAAQRFYLRDMKRAIAAIPTGPGEAGDIKSEAEKLQRAVMEPENTMAGAKNFAFFMYLAGSVTSAVINATQSITMTWPRLMEHGEARGTAALLKAMPYALGLKSIPAGTPLAKALKKASEEGRVEAQEIFHLYSVAISGTTSKIGGDAMRSRMQGALSMLSWMFGIAELMNRRLAFIASYNMAEQMGHANPYEFASDIVDETQGVYNKANTPNWARNPVGSVLLIFKQWGLNYVEMLKRMWSRGARGKLAVGYALAIMILMAGTEGLPFMKAFNDIIDTVGQFTGHNTNSKRWKREVLQKYLGHAGAEFAQYGVSSVLPFDISQRVGVNNIIPATDVLKKSLDTKDRMKSGAEVFGAGGGLIKQAIDAFDAASAGDYGDAGWAMAPKFAADAKKGVDMLREGRATDSQGRKSTEVSKAGAVAQIFGGNPIEKARGGRMRGEIMQDRKMAEAMEKEVNQLYVRGAVDHNPELQQRAIKRLQEWNRENPGLPIKLHKRGASMGLMDADQRMIMGTPKSQRGEVARRLKDK